MADVGQNGANLAGTDLGHIAAQVFVVRRRHGPVPLRDLVPVVGFVVKSGMRRAECPTRGHRLGGDTSLAAHIVMGLTVHWARVVHGKCRTRGDGGGGEARRLQEWVMWQDYGSAAGGYRQDPTANFSDNNVVFGD